MSTVVSLRFHRLLNIAGFIIGLCLLIYVAAYATDFNNARTITAKIESVDYKKDYKNLDTVKVVFTYTDERGTATTGYITLLKMALDKRIIIDQKNIRLRQNGAGTFYPDSHRELRCLVIATLIWWGMMGWSARRCIHKRKSMTPVS